MDKFNLDLSLVARLDGHPAPRAHRGRATDWEVSQVCKFIIPPRGPLTVSKTDHEG